MRVTVRERKQGRGGWEVDISVRLTTGESVRWRGKSPLESKSASKRWGEERARHIAMHGLPEKPGPKPEDKPNDVPTLAEFAPRYTAGYTEANRQKHSNAITKQSHLRVHLIPMMGSMRLDAIGPEQIAALKSRLADRSAKYTNNILATLSTIMKVAIEWGIIETMPKIVLLQATAPVMDFFDFDEYERMVAAAAKIDPRVHLAVLLGGDAGLRPGEVRGLKWTCVDFGRRMLTIELAEYRGVYSTPKHGKIRRVPMTHRLAAALAAHRHLSEFVLLNDDGRPLTFACHRNMIEKSTRRAVLRSKGPHTLRHTFCSHLAMRGAPAKAIQVAAGHADLTTTQKYMHLSPAALEQAIALLDLGREPVRQVMDDNRMSNIGPAGAGKKR